MDPPRVSTARNFVRQRPDPRALLRRIRAIMVDALGAQERLDAIVAEIACNMAADVSSVYVLRADRVLELYATRGLNPEAVHISQLALGDGLVGTIAASARALALDDAQSHPAFRYLPETGEEIYHSFLGVPILRGGRTLGVVTVQHKEQHRFEPDEIEGMETVAMVLAELVANGELSTLTRTGIELDTARPLTVEGSGLSDGIGLGHVVLHDPRIQVTELFAEDVDAEARRLDEALGSLRLSIDDMLSRRDVAAEGEHRAVLEAYRMFAHDAGWNRRLAEAVRNGLTAEGAVEKVQSDTRARMLHVQDPYLRERLDDFDDLAHRLLLQLTGRDPTSRAEDLPRDGIVVARSMGAAELLDYPADRLRGLVLEEGAMTSHVAIVARAMGLAVVGQARGVVAMAENGDPIIVDGDEGLVHLRPPTELEATYAEKVRFRARRQEQYAALRETPCVTRDGIEVALHMNGGLLADVEQLADTGAEGIGLFRTELQFMVASQFPRTEAQESFYGSVMDAAGKRAVTFRLLDIGGDKVLPYFHAAEEENPALGWRAVRLSLDRPALMRVQMRALIRAAAGRPLRIMVPMVTCVSEIEAARLHLAKEVEQAERHDRPVPSRVEFGAMIEVPSLMAQLDELMEAVDFVSVGSNDLFQFVMATDRGNPRLARRFDVLHPAFLRVLRTIREAADRHGTPLTLCGEMASRPVTAMALVALGYRSLSMSPAGIGPVKAALLGLDVSRLAAEIDAALDAPLEPGPVPPSLRDAIEVHAARESVPI